MSASTVAPWNRLRATAPGAQRRARDARSSRSAGPERSRGPGAIDERAGVIGDRTRIGLNIQVPANGGLLQCDYRRIDDRRILRRVQRDVPGTINRKTIKIDAAANGCEYRITAINVNNTRICDVTADRRSPQISRYIDTGSNKSNILKVHNRRIRGCRQIQCPGNIQVVRNHTARSRRTQIRVTANRDQPNIG